MADDEKTVQLRTQEILQAGKHKARRKRRRTFEEWWDDAPRIKIIEWIDRQEPVVMLLAGLALGCILCAAAAAIGIWGPWDVF